MSAHAVPRAVDAAAVLAATGLDARHLGALRAFAHAVPRTELEAAFAGCIESLRHAPPSPAGMRFLDLLLDASRWGDPQWLDELATAWQPCRASGRDEGLLAASMSALVEAVQGILDEGRSSSAQAEILRAATRFGHAVHALLAASVVGEEEANRIADASLDPVTGLPARARFLLVVEEAMRQAGGRPLGLVLIDVGAVARRDRLRWQLTQAMRHALRPRDVLCSVSEQEWALVMPDLISAAQPRLAAARLIEVCEASLEDGLSRLRSTIHAGTACAPDDGASATTLERAARAALHRANRDRSPTVHFEGPMLIEMEHELELEREVAHSMARPPFMVWLQPQVHLGSGRCIGAEALLRWQRRDGSWVSPPELVALAVRLGLMPELSRWLIAQVARLIRTLNDAGIPITVALNLTADDLHDEELPALVAQALATWQAPASHLILEVTEGALIGDRMRAARIVRQLRELGCGVSLDDFGTGYSSFAYMRDLPVSELKIDQLFVRELLASPRDQAIVTSVQALASGFGLSVVAEGVEDPRTAAELKRLGCDHAQGFLYSPAVPVEEFVSWFRARNGTG